MRITASCALPFFNIWCPGKTERKLSSSGAPRKTDGMKSKNVWVIAREVMKTTKTISGIAEKFAKRDIKITAMRFICIPGINPVMVPKTVPARRPRIIVSGISKSIKYKIPESLYVYLRVVAFYEFEFSRGMKIL